MKRLILLIFFQLLLGAFDGLCHVGACGVDINSSSVEGKTDTIAICSFNIQFLGHFKNRDNEFLSGLLNNFELILIQEMVAPPVSGMYPDGKKYNADVESKAFHDLMIADGFSFWMSEEDTGPKKNHTASSGSEWWIAYYKGDVLQADTLERAYGFIDKKRTLNETFERVPYAFPFKSINGGLNFTVISVHLAPGSSRASEERRFEELSGITNWINHRTDDNRDFMIAGDCNIENDAELQKVLNGNKWFDKPDLWSLNDSCISTNTKCYESASKGRPYDHVLYGEATIEDLVPESFEIIDLLSRCQEGSISSYSYDHDKFRTKYSDHLPITFKLIVDRDGD